MYALIIDDNAEFAKTLSGVLYPTLDPILFTTRSHSEFPDYCHVDNIGDDLPRLANKVVELTNHQEVLFMSANLRIGSEGRQSQKGVELLTWLRLFNCDSHCVLYSFQTAHSLLKMQPRNTILYSKGTTFLQLPGDFKLVLAKVSLLKEEIAEKENLKQCLKAAFDIQQFRHREANWWGIKSLWDVHRIKTYGVFNIEYPAGLRRKLEELNNCIADFCYGAGIQRIDRYIQTLDDELSEQLDLSKQELRDAEKKHEESQSRLSRLKDSWNSITGQLSYLKDKCLRFIKFLPASERKETAQEMAELQKKKEDEESKLERQQNEGQTNAHTVETIRQHIQEIERKRKNIFATVRSDFFSEQIPEVSSETKILHIDDQANEGWSEIFQHMIYGMIDAEHFKMLSFNSSMAADQKIDTKVDDIMNELGRLIGDHIGGATSFDPDVILLDLRLIPAYDQRKTLDVVGMSGALLLKQIRAEYPGLPVIVTTASNKAWTLQQLIKIGADGYWIKEGLDEQRTATDSVQNYVDFLRLVSTASLKEYQDMKKVVRHVMSLWERHNGGRSFWWEKKDWNFEYILVHNGKEHTIIPRHTEVASDAIKTILLDSLAMLRQYYQVKIMGYGYNTFSNEEWHMAAQVIMDLSNIIEMVHNFDRIRANVLEARRRCGIRRLKYRYYNDVVTIEGLSYPERIRRQDAEGGKLYDIRNRAAHYSTARQLNYEDMIQFFNGLLKYLDSDPPGNRELVRRYERALLVYNAANGGNEVENDHRE